MISPLHTQVLQNPNKRGKWHPDAAIQPTAGMSNEDNIKTWKLIEYTRAIEFS